MVSQRIEMSRHIRLYLPEVTTVLESLTKF